MDAISRRAWALSIERGQQADVQADASRTQYAIKVGAFFIGRNGNGTHWAQGPDDALMFDHLTTAELFAFGRLGMGASEFTVEAV